MTSKSGWVGRDLAIARAVLRTRSTMFISTLEISGCRVLRRVSETRSLTVIFVMGRVVTSHSVDHDFVSCVYDSLFLRSGIHGVPV